MAVGQLVWMPPASGTNEHIEVFLIDPITKQPISNSNVTVSILDANNRVIGTQQFIYLWSPKGFHYGSNWTIPASGNYTVRIDIQPPQFARHDRNQGTRFSKPVTATFTNVRLMPEGQQTG